MATNPLRKAQYPLAGSALSPTVFAAKPKQPVGSSPAPLSIFGQNLTPPPVPSAPPPLPGLNSSVADALQRAQTQANQANQQRYGQGLGVLTGGLGATQGSIQNAINSSNTYGQSAQQKLNLQLQQALGQQSQSAVGRGLENTTVADTMKDLPTRQYNDASAQVSEMAANRMSGLYLNQANANQQGAGSIANYIAGRNDQGPDMRAYMQAAQSAAAVPQKRVVSTMSGAPPSLGSFMNNMASGGTGDEPAGTFRSGGGGGSSSGGAGTYYNAAGGGGATQSASQGYTGSSTPLPSGGSSPDQPSQVMQNAGFGAGSISIKPSGSSPTPQVGASSPAAATPAAAPVSIAAATGGAAPSAGGQGYGNRNPDNGSTSQGADGTIYATIGGHRVKWGGSQWVGV